MSIQSKQTDQYLRDVLERHQPFVCRVNAEVLHQESYSSGSSNKTAKLSFSKEKEEDGASL